MKMHKINKLANRLQIIFFTVFMNQDLFLKFDNFS